MNEIESKNQIRERVRFVLINPEAHEVFVTGSFNNWNPCTTPLSDIGHGHWVADVWLPLGRHEYQFVVDGRWMQDRTAKEWAVNPFRGINSVIVVARRPFTTDRLAYEPKQIKSKWAWHCRVLLALRERLVRDQTERLGEAGEPLEPHSMDLADSATDEFDHNLALGDLSAKQDAIYEVDQALRRIVDGTYGACEATGKSIPAARLRAVPWTRFSKEVELELEKYGTVSYAGLGQLDSIVCA